MSVGIPPGTGFELNDGIWLNGVVSGQNETARGNLTSTGTTHATAFQLPANIAFFEIDNGNASSGIALPFAIPGNSLSIANQTGVAIVLYPAIANNASGVQDVINGVASVTMANNTAATVFCAIAGSWGLTS